MKGTSSVINELRTLVGKAFGGNDAETVPTKTIRARLSAFAGRIYPAEEPCLDFSGTTLEGIAPELVDAPPRELCRHITRLRSQRRMDTVLAIAGHALSKERASEIVASEMGVICWSKGDFETAFEIFDEVIKSGAARPMTLWRALVAALATRRWAEAESLAKQLDGQRNPMSRMRLAVRLEPIIARGAAPNDEDLAEIRSLAADVPSWVREYQALGLNAALKDDDGDRERLRSLRRVADAMGARLELPHEPPGWLQDLLDNDAQARLEALAFGNLSPEFAARTVDEIDIDAVQDPELLVGVVWALLSLRRMAAASDVLLRFTQNADRLIESLGQKIPKSEAHELLSLAAKAVERRPEADAATRGFALLAFHYHRMDLAAPLLERLADQPEADLEVVKALLTCGVLTQNVAQADAAATRYLELDPCASEVRQQRAQIAFDRNDFEAAADFARGAMRSEDHEGAAALLLAVVYRTQARHDEAADHARIAWLSTSLDDAARRRARNIYFCCAALSETSTVRIRLIEDLTGVTSGRAVASRDAAAQKLNWDETVAAGALLRSLGEAEAAATVFSGLLERSPSSDVTHLCRALALTESGQTEAADRVFETTPSLPALKPDWERLRTERARPETPVVTIVVPCFNESKFLHDCLFSVWAQSYPFWECVIVDDQSTDASQAIARAFVAADPRFRHVVRETNGGLAAARNSGLAAARGQYVTFIDSDDYMAVQSVLVRLKRLYQAGSPMVAGSYCGVKQTPERLYGDLLTGLPGVSLQDRSILNAPFEAPFNAHAPLIVTDTLRSFGGFDESMRFGAEDWDCWSRMMRAGMVFQAAPFVALAYRKKRGSMVRSMAAKHVAAATDIFRRTLRAKDIGLDSPARAPLSLDAPAWAYAPAADFIRRSITFAAMAALAGDKDGFEKIIAGMPGSTKFLRVAQIDVRKQVKTGVDRFFADVDTKFLGRSRDGYAENRAAVIAEQILARLDVRQNDGVKAFIEHVSGAPATPVDDEAETGAASAPAAPPFGAPALAVDLALLRLEEPDREHADPERMLQYKNIHVGERCFIVGNGPSLNQLDLSRLANESSFAVNGIFYKTEQMGYRPNYFVVEDTSVMRENIAAIKAYEVEHKFFPSMYHALHPRDENVNFFQMNRGFYEKRSDNFCIPRFSTDAAARLYCGQSVTYINLQLAFYMGFHEVYLIGMDFSYNIPAEFEKKGDIITSTGDDPNHFHPDYFGKGKTWKDPKLDRVLNNYRMAQLAFEAAGRKIYNATAGGKLELFPRVDFNSLF